MVKEGQVCDFIRGLFFHTVIHLKTNQPFTFQELQHMQVNITVSYNTQQTGNSLKLTLNLFQSIWAHEYKAPISQKSKFSLWI